MAKPLWADRKILFALGLLLAILVLGLAGTWALSEEGRRITADTWVRAARSAAAGIAAEDLEPLSTGPGDSGAPAFERVRQHLSRVRSANPDARFVYLMALRNDQVVFVADAEPEDSPDASAPGDLYPEASPKLVEAFASGIAFLEGPLRDRWGEWVSGFAPVRDPETGKAVAMLGLDWDAREWHLEINIYRWFGLMLTVFPLLLAGAVFAGLVRVERVNLLLTEEMKERRRIQAELERLSKMDPLTGLANRRTFDMMYDLEWRRALRAQLPLSLVMIDVDWFKAYNDHYGHQQGDAALRRIGEAIRDSVKRAGDEPGRYGGEEFVAILPSAGPEGACHVAETIRANVEALAIAHEAAGHGSCLTVSVGVATVMPTTADAPGTLIARADQALYRAKSAGRNRVERDLP